jgi:hypothetical protein
VVDACPGGQGPRAPMGMTPTSPGST